MAKTKIHGDMLVGDVLRKVPEAAVIMEDYGLHCTGCSVKSFESVKNGALAHGFSEERIVEMLKEINAIFEKKASLAPDDGIYLTEAAAEKIKEFAAAEKKEGYGLKIEAEDNKGNEPAYAMDFQEKAGKGEKTFEFHGVNIFMSESSLKNMLGAVVDYLETAYGNGFKIDNPAFEEKACCGGGGCGSHEGSEGEGGGCGGGSCGCKG